MFLSLVCDHEMIQLDRVHGVQVQEGDICGITPLNTELLTLLRKRFRVSDRIHFAQYLLLFVS